MNLQSKNYSFTSSCDNQTINKINNTRSSKIISLKATLNKFKRAKNISFLRQKIYLLQSQQQNHLNNSSQKMNYHTQTLQDKYKNQKDKNYFIINKNHKTLTGHNQSNKSKQSIRSKENLLQTKQEFKSYIKKIKDYHSKFTIKKGINNKKNSQNTDKIQQSQNFINIVNNQNLSFQEQQSINTTVQLKNESINKIDISEFTIKTQQSSNKQKQYNFHFNDKILKRSVAYYNKKHQKFIKNDQNDIRRSKTEQQIKCETLQIQQELIKQTNLQKMQQEKQTIIEKPSIISINEMKKIIPRTSNKFQLTKNKLKQQQGKLNQINIKLLQSQKTLQIFGVQKISPNKHEIKILRNQINKSTDQQNINNLKTINNQIKQKQSIEQLNLLDNRNILSRNSQKSDKCNSLIHSTKGQNKFRSTHVPKQYRNTIYNSNLKDTLLSEKQQKDNLLFYSSNKKFKKFHISSKKINFSISTSKIIDVNNLVIQRRRLIPTASYKSRDQNQFANKRNTKVYTSQKRRTQGNFLNRGYLTQQQAQYQEFNDYFSGWQRPYDNFNDQIIINHQKITPLF